MIWAIENPRRGVVDADELDHDRILAIQEPYLGRLVGAYTEWTPLDNRAWHLFPEDIDRTIPGSSRTSSCVSLRKCQSRRSRCMG